MGAAAIPVALWLLISALKKKPVPPAKAPGNTGESIFAADPVITEGLRQHALRFMGLYEGIYTAVQTRSPDAMDAYREWHIRMENLRSDGPFYEAFRARFPETGAEESHLQDLLHCFEAAGIRRDTQTVHTAGSETGKQYIYMGADELCIGKEYKILKPCWKLDGITVQQGLLIPMEGQ